MFFNLALEETFLGCLRDTEEIDLMRITPVFLLIKNHVSNWLAPDFSDFINQKRIF